MEIDEANLTLAKVREMLESLKPLHPRQDLLTSPAAEAKLRNALPVEETPFAGPWGMTVHVVDWVEPDEYFMGSPKLIQSLVEIGETYGGQIAKALLEKISVRPEEKNGD